MSKYLALRLEVEKQKLELGNDVHLTCVQKHTILDRLQFGEFLLIYTVPKTRGQSNLTKSASRSRGAHSPVRGHPRGSKVVPLNSWGRVSY